MNHLETLSIWFERAEYDEKTHAASTWIFETCLSNLKSLKYLSIHTHNRRSSQHHSGRLFYCLPSRLTSKYISWQHLHIPGIWINRFDVFLSCLPNLQTISTGTKLDHSISVYPMMPCLQRCKLQILESPFSSIVAFLSQCPNLQRLSLSGMTVDIDIFDDKQWQAAIERHLTQLKRFKIDLFSVPLALEAAERLCTTSFQSDLFWQERKTRVDIREQYGHGSEAKRLQLCVQFNDEIKSKDMP